MNRNKAEALSPPKVPKVTDEVVFPNSGVMPWRGVRQARKAAHSSGNSG